MKTFLNDVIKCVGYLLVVFSPILLFVPMRTTIIQYAYDQAVILLLVVPIVFLCLATLHHHFFPRNAFSLIFMATAILVMVASAALGIADEWDRLRPLTQSVSGLGYIQVTEAVDRNLLYGLVPALLAFFLCLRITLDNHRKATVAIQRQSFTPAESGTHGSAVMGNVKDAAKHFTKGSLILGEAYDPKRKPKLGGKAPLLWWNANGHAMTVSGPGGGKTASVVIPNLLVTSFSVVVNDPKGEVYAVTKEARADRGHEVYRLDSENEETHGFNVLDWLDPAFDKIGEHVNTIVQLMSVIGQSEDNANAIFRENGENIVAIMILEVMFDDTIPTEEKTLLKVRERLIETDILKQLRKIADMDKDHCFGITPNRARAIINYAERSGKTFGNFYIYAEQITRFLTIPSLARLVCGNSFTTADLLEGKTDVFVTIPPMSQQNNPALARLIIGTLANRVWLAHGKVANRILFMLDEMGTLGHIPVLEKIRDNMRGLGVTIWGIVQTLEQLRGPAGGDGITGWEAGTTVWQMFGVTGLKTADHASRLTGMTTVLSRTETEGSGGSHTMAKLGSRTVSKSRGENVSEVGRPVMTADEVRNMATDANGDPDEQLLLIRNYRPLRCGMAKYWRRQQLNDIANLNPLFEQSKQWGNEDGADRHAKVDAALGV